MYTSGEGVSHVICTHHLILSSLYVAAPVIDPPSLSVVKVAVGDPLTLACTSRGSPPDTFTWMKDRGPLLQSTSITTVTHTSTSAVFRADYTINRITTSDNGIYKCNVTNPIGSDSEIIAVVASKLCFVCRSYCTFCIFFL